MALVQAAIMWSACSAQCHLLQIWRCPIGPFWALAVNDRWPGQFQTKRDLDKMELVISPRRIASRISVSRKGSGVFAITLWKVCLRRSDFSKRPFDVGSHYAVAHAWSLFVLRRE